MFDYSHRLQYLSTRALQVINSSLSLVITSCRTIWPFTKLLDSSPHHLMPVPLKQTLIQKPPSHIQPYGFKPIQFIIGKLLLFFHISLSLYSAISLIRFSANCYKLLFFLPSDLYKRRSKVEVQEEGRARLEVQNPAQRKKQMPMLEVNIVYKIYYDCMAYLPTYLETDLCF